MQYYSISYTSPLGKATLLSDGEHIIGLWFEGQKYYGSGLCGEWRTGADVAALDRGKKWLDAYFAGERPTAEELPLAPAGSAFRQLIWQLLAEIPYGSVTTYAKLAKEVARRLGRSDMANQAIGGAVGHNPISVILPCHRVVGADGSLTGYAGGIDKKLWLLTHEGTNLKGLYVPKKGTAL